MKRRVVAGLLAFGWLGAAHAQHPGTHVHGKPEARAQYGQSFERFAGEMNVGMEKMMSDMHAPGYTGDPDIDFLAMMIPHHEGAVDMARLVLQHGNDPVTRKLAEDIVASQRVEIEGMRRRLDDLRRGASRIDPGGYPALGGTRGG
ncbi:MAG TPA: DUF305 domain-containing protein [Thiobacillus sp.]|nr:MAG: hypothetical protein B7Y50_02780 [Hydrogenophilales bacterium 28-61-11]OYZ58954.1 MAG: hypothetical protein B7Y21_01300 [Hydrogenophilales bacterium 16-61-112]OZA46599.1 MAG: hypothetical protein B7X81_06765 [Hydrogenophilales bacterium 17-61-76]HQT30350.1 DUF305 domain-containing protein [Thiobacillus sp.]HQT69038.1 DUF305 domain-containing protein [Thiobacillus sp.]